MEATVNAVSNAAKRAVNAFATDNFTTSGASGLVRCLTYEAFFLR